MKDSVLGRLVIYLLKTYYLVFQSFDFERTWWRFIQKCIVQTKLDVHIFIAENW